MCVFNVTPQSLCFSATQSFGISTFVYVCACVKARRCTDTQSAMEEVEETQSKHVLSTKLLIMLFLFLSGKMLRDYDR